MHKRVWKMYKIFHSSAHKVSKEDEESSIRKVMRYKIEENEKFEVGNMEKNEHLQHMEIFSSHCNILIEAFSYMKYLSQVLRCFALLCFVEGILFLFTSLV